VNAISAKVPERFIELLKRNSAVEYVEEDAIAFALGHSSSPTAQYGNMWGVNHIEADLAHSKTLGAGVNVAIIDTASTTTTPRHKA
jgi:subtilisin